MDITKSAVETKEGIKQEVKEYKLFNSQNKRKKRGVQTKPIDPDIIDVVTTSIIAP